MLLPSDVARLVLGYLQQEKLLATCQAFILESSDLKEYAEHCTGEGFVPACLLSLFGKNLITILNEYVTLKSKEAPNDVPAMMSSLWKKLDYTLAQIRIMQMSSGFAAHQRSRTRSAIADMKKQKCLHQSSSSNLGMSSVTHQQGQLNSIPMTATQVVLKPVITPSPAHIRLLGSSSAHQGEIQENHVGAENSLNLVSTFQERKLHSSVMSPGKRKSDSQKKKNIGSSGPQSSNSDLQDSLTAEEESSPMEEENEQLEFIDGDLPQMIIENAREKILSNKCLQEKLAENINKFLGSDGNISQAAKQAESGPTIQESSIDEFLDLQQSEIHMTEEAIQEILEKTESDPAFQGLYDIFDFGKTKGNRNAPHGISTQEGGIENAILVDEENLEALESYIATKELGDNSQGCLPYTDDSKETCILKTDCNGSDGTMAEHLKMQVVATGEFPGGSKETSDSDSVETPGCKNTLESGESQFTHPEFTGGHNVGTYNQQGTAIRDCEMEKDLLCQDVQPLPDLQYDHLVAPQTSLAGSAECCSVPNNILSEKTNAKLLTPPRTGDSEIMKGYIVSPIRSAESEKNLEQITKQSMMIPEPGPQNQNSPPLSHGQSQEKLESDSSTALGNTSDPNSVEVQLGVVDTSNSLRSDDLPDHQESCSEHQTQNLEDSGIAQVDMQEPSSSTKADADSMVLASDSEMHTELATENSSTSPTVSHSPAPVGESSPGNKVAATVSSSSQATNVDPSSIVSLKIIISDDPFISSDTELNSAVSSITGENMPTIILSSPGQSPAKMTRPSNCRTSEESEKIGDAALMEQNLLVLRPQDSVASTLNVQNEECAVFSISEASNVAKDGGFIQLMPATTASFNNSNNVYIATCVTEPTALSTNVTSSNLVVLPGSSTALASQVPTPQQLRTPPRTNNLFTMNPPMSPNFPQGSAIIITSPVQPVLQGMVGMIPVSIMGQSGNTFSDPSPQILHLPIQASLGRGSVPKLPLPPKSQRIPRNKSNTGRMVLSGSESVNCPGSQVQRIGNSDKSTCGDVKKKLEVVAGDTTSSISKQSESHRRVLCFDKGLATPVDNTHVSQKERKENALVPGNSPNTVLSSAKIQSSKRERERTLPRILCKPDITNRSSAVKEIQSERKSSGPGLASDVLRKQTANKENELERTVDRTPQNQEVATLPSSQQNISLHNEKNSSLSQELTKKQGLQSNTNSKNSGVLPSKEPKKDQGKSPNQSHSLTSPLTKQAMEIFHDIQRQSPASKQPESVDLPVPRTPSGMGDRHSDDSFDIVRTPTCRRYSEDSTTPRIMVPPATPDLPACSPASETSSENSVSMAAHTLMILSRAAIARTSAATPLKDNTQQLKSLRSAAKKRKQEDLVECEKNSRTANKKDLQNFTVPMKKKKVKKKLPIAFPAGMDVDKFLLSLHYDE